MLMAALAAAASSALEAILSSSTPDLAYGDFPQNLQKDLDELINLLSKGYFYLLANVFFVSKLGRNVKGLHPLTSWIFFLDPGRKKIIQTIMAPSFFFFNPLKHSFVSSNVQIFENRDKTGQIIPNIDDFAQRTGLDAGVIRSFAVNKDWNGLIEFLAK